MIRQDSRDKEIQEDFFHRHGVCVSYFKEKKQLP